ncbi:MAG TPA: hypothetical protein VHG28_21650 [Longimicrobiaceae bacterium]|nr:hypothetical protein [Longimicrobiaceae bacterium]
MRPSRLLLLVLPLSCIPAGIAAVSAATPEGSSSVRTGIGSRGSPSSPEIPMVRWVFRKEDLITCRTAAYALRHLKATLGSEVRITALAVDMDEGFARSFLRSERLPIELLTVPAHRLESRYGDTPPPGLYVLLGDSLVQAFPAGRGHDYPEVQTLERSILPLLYPQEASDAGHHLPPSPTERSVS